MTRRSARPLLILAALSLPTVREDLVPGNLAKEFDWSRTPIEPFRLDPTP